MTSSKPDLYKENTLPRLLRYNYRKYGSHKVALREKVRGTWKRHTWEDYYHVVEYLALAFHELGLQPNDKVAILGENKPHVYWFELAAQANQATVVGVFSDCSSEEVKFFVEHADCSFVICQDQEQVDKLLDIKHEIPLVKKVIYWDPKGMWSYEDSLLLTMSEMLEMGKGQSALQPQLFEQLIDRTDGRDIAVFFFTSGTTGLPKAAMVSHRTIIGMGDLIKHGIAYNDEDRTVSYVPIAWIGEQMFNVVCSLVYGFTVNFPENQETVAQNIREIGPTILYLGPRQWEEHIRTIRVKMLNAQWFNRVLFNISMKIGYKVGNDRMAGKNPGWGRQLLYAMADKIIFRPLRDRLGLSKVRRAFTAGSAISPDVLRYFHGIGVPLTQMYGSSEIGAVSIHTPGDVKPETCGKPLNGYKVRTTEEGEILINSDYLFQGYYKNPKKTAEVLKDGWYYTGDFGRLDKDGHLIVMDRIGDLRPIAGNRHFSPQFAETRLRFSSYLKDAIVVGTSEMDFAVALVNIDYDNVGKWAENRKIPYTTYLDLSQKKETLELAKAEIQNINQALPEWAQIKKFISLPKQFDPDEAELTRTRKIRRDFLEDKYQDMITALYADKQQIEVTLSVTYRDGSSDNIITSVPINQI